MTGAIHRTGTSIALLARTVGEPALARALPLYAGIAIVAAVLFGPTGMSAADVMVVMAGSPWARLVLWSAWLVATAPAARALYRGEGALYLRTLPMARWLHLAVPALLGVLLHGAWIGLHIRGAGLEAGLTAALVSSTAGAIIAVRGRGPIEEVARALCAAALVVALWWAVSAPVVAAVAAALYPAAVYAAWVRAPERGRRLGLVRIAGPAPLALGLSALAWTWRGSRSVLGRTLFWTGVGGAGIGLASRANQLDAAGFGALFVAVSGLAFAAALGAVATSMVEHERAARWLLDTTGAGGGVRVAAAAVPAVAVGLACGVAVGLLAARLAGGGGDLVRGLIYGGAGGAAWALIALAAARRCERDRGVDGTLVFVLLFAVAIAVAVATAVFGEVALVLVLALAAGGSLWGADRAAVERRAA